MKKVVFFEAVSTMIGTIIGAGILGIPYVFSRAGFWTGSLVLVLVGLAMTLMKLMYGEVTLRTKGSHQVTGYTEIYLGKIAKYIMGFVMIFSIHGSILAYSIGEGEVIEAITGVPQFWASLVFFIIFALFVYVGLFMIKRMEIWMTGVILLIVLAIGVISFQNMHFENLAGFDITKSFVPYGVILFACSGIVAVPEVRRILSRRENLLGKAIFWGCITPPIVYFVFSAFVITITDGQVTEVATIALGSVLGWKMVLIANIFAFFTIATSFLTLGLALKDIYQFDYKLNKNLAWVLFVAVPLAIFFAGAHDFVRVLSFVGAVGIGIAGGLEVLTYFIARKKGTRKPEYEIPAWLGIPMGAVLIVMFFGGAFYAIMSYL